ncbi:MAG: ABC transporter ATP-binding protein [Bacteroidetes bacterium]|nr:ABC transporter ATP-binding protein [Bacteroidota bacterium]
MNKEHVITIDNLSFSFDTYAGEVQAVRGVSFYVQKGETLGIVGESGCGKSVTAKAVTKLNPMPPGRMKEGRIFLEEKEISNFTAKEMKCIRARDIRMIFQDPMTSLNPTMKIGKQIVEGITKCYTDITKEQARDRAIEMLKLVGLPSPEMRFKQYPHEFSGGMRQRAMIALAMAVNPKLLIADEPTTALDVTTQSQILELMKKIQKEFGTSIIMITHDLGVIANIATRVAVMYAGKIVETGSVDDIFKNPQHPYTWGLLNSIPLLDSDAKEDLTPIEGTPPDLFKPPKGCPFAARCFYRMKVCSSHFPPQMDASEKHFAHCWLYHTSAPGVKNPITGRKTGVGNE